MKAYLLDMDGLLIDSEPLWRAAEIDAFKAAGTTLTEEDCRKTMGMRIDEVVNYWCDRRPEITVGDKARQKIADTIVSNMKMLIRDKAELMPGAAELIRYIGENRIPSALASSSYPVLIETAAEKFNWKKTIPVRVSASETQYGKPHPELFLLAAQKLRLSPGVCTVFEDSLHGVIAAKAAGMKVIAVPEARQINDPRFSLADELYPSLTEYLKKLHADA